MLHGRNSMSQHPRDENIFSLATLLYARLRKVNSRVIDVVYLMQNPEYALHAANLALETNDAELQGYAIRLKLALDLHDDEEQASPQTKKQDTTDEGHVSFSLF